ncbi:hypothetical protein CesoFtcFv8_007993 [Champsocephalus esox]|uniref:Group XV phospholipase A2 n=1 Tax=Champsocephalus esox TaxID=159716 RepID=A0AAN8H527_9TELE|nr:hypothetical protein CesoFtcFv8_007993 [Champsocephalus esox]
MAAWHRITALSSLLQVGLLLLLFSTRSSGRTLEKCLGGKSCQPPRPPVVLIPGDLGNQLEAKLDKPSVVHYICYKKTDFFTLWLNLELLIPVAIDCWIDNIRLIYNSTTHSSSSPPGVEIHVPGFGQTYSLEYLDPSKRSVGIYFFSIVQAMVEWGYTRDDDVRGAPYDWRKAPNENKEYFLALQKMIEEMAEKAGGPVTLRVLISGDNNHIPVISPLKIRSQQRSAVSTSWLLPYAHSWAKDQVLVQTPTTNYTVLDYQRLYKDINFEDGWMMRQDTEPLVADLRPPGVAVHCLYGSGIPTQASFQYTDKFPDVEPTVVMSDGDGTVNLQSAKQCGLWVGRQKQPVTLKELDGNEHVDMLLNFTTVAYIKDVLFSP